MASACGPDALSRAQPALLELLTATSLDDWRPFHGHLTAVELVGANGERPATTW